MHWRNMTLSTVVMVWKNLEMTDGNWLFLCFVYKPIIPSCLPIGKDSGMVAFHHFGDQLVHLQP